MLTPAVMAARAASARSSIDICLGFDDVMLAKINDGQNALDDDTLRDHRFEFVVDEINGVDLLVNIAGSNLLGQLATRRRTPPCRAARGDRR